MTDYDANLVRIIRRECYYVEQGVIPADQAAVNIMREVDFHIRLIYGTPPAKTGIGALLDRTPPWAPKRDDDL